MVSVHFSSQEMVLVTTIYGDWQPRFWHRSAATGRLNAWRKATTTTAYNAAGWVDTVTDPRGIQSKTFYDNLGRTTKSGKEKGKEKGTQLFFC